jgi:hypothetical protein
MGIRYSGPTLSTCILALLPSAIRLALLQTCKRIIVISYIPAFCWQANKATNPKLLHTTIQSSKQSFLLFLSHSAKRRAHRGDSVQLLGRLEEMKIGRFVKRNRNGVFIYGRMNLSFTFIFLLFSLIFLVIQPYIFASLSLLLSFYISQNLLNVQHNFLDSK